MMVPRSRPWPALLISALVHLGVALLLLGRSGSPAVAEGRGALPGPVLQVRLLAASPPPSPAPAPAQETEPAPAQLEQPAMAAVQAPQPVAVPAGAEAVKQEAGDAKPVESGYLEASAMTRQPQVVSGLVSDTLLIVPGLKAQGVALQVWINEDGAVDRVELDTQMSEADQELLLAEFVKVRFSPGRVGRLPVRSHISMQILVDNAIRA